ncbi:MAG: hypothetical protein ACRDJH_08050 [Thermomicrobiales bacterium]
MRQCLDSRWTLWLSTVIASLGWLALYRWYGLPDHQNDLFFAFEKVPGRSHSFTLRATGGILLGIGLAYGVGLWSLSHIETISRRIKAAVILAAVVPGVVNVLLYPVGALDVFNYLVELKLAFHYDENPYLTTFENYRADSFAKPAFLTDIKLFYGPVWLLLSGLPAVFTGFGNFVNLLIGLKILNLALLAATAVAIRRHYADTRRGWLAVYAFLANPLVLFEGVGNGHNDVMMTAFLVVAVVALERQSALGFALLALSGLVKFFSLAVLPVAILLVRRHRWPINRITAAIAITAVAIIAMLAPYWAGGEMIDGLRAGMNESQEMSHVSPYSLAQQYVRDNPYTGERIVALFTPSQWIEDESPRAWASLDSLESASKRYVTFRRELTEEEQQALRRGFTALFLGLTAIVLWTMRRGNPPMRAMVHILLLFCLLMTNLYPWYLIPIFALLALSLNRLGIIYLAVQTTLGLAYYPLYVWAHYDSSFAFNKLHVHLFLALFLTLPIIAFLAWDAVLGVRILLRDRSAPSAQATAPGA